MACVTLGITDAERETEIEKERERQRDRDRDIENKTKKVRGVRETKKTATQRAIGGGHLLVCGEGLNRVS